MTADTIRRARELVAVVDLAGERGTTPFARQARYIARELLDALDALEAERSARQAIQANYARVLTVLERQAGDATLPDAFRTRAQDTIDAEEEP